MPEVTASMIFHLFALAAFAAAPTDAGAPYIETFHRPGKTLVYVVGLGADRFTGGFENDTIHVSAAAVGGDTLTGGSGTNTVILTSAGTLSLGGVSNFSPINLASGNSAVTVTPPGGTQATFSYASLPGPIVLAAGATYYMVSTEDDAQDAEHRMA